LRLKRSSKHWCRRFTVAHRPGKKHANADALSRRPCTRAQCACNSDETGAVETDVFTVGCRERDRETSYQDDAPTTFGGAADHPADDSNHDNNDDDGDIPPDTILPWSFEGLICAQRDDPDIGPIVKLLKSSAGKPPWEAVALCSADTKALWHQWPRLTIQQGLLRRSFESADGKFVKWQIVWPSALRRQILEIAHGGMTSGHLSRRRTAATIQSRIYWPTWSADLNEFLHSCPQCCRYHRGKIRPQAELQTQRSVCNDYKDFVQPVKQHVTGAHQIVREHLKKNAERRKSGYDIRVRQQQFQLGDWIWYYYPRRYKHKSQKRQKRYTGPFLVVRVILPSNYVLQKSPLSKAFVVSADKLKRCFGDTPSSWLSQAKVTGTEPPLDLTEVPPTCSAPPVTCRYAVNTGVVVDKSLSRTAMLSPKYSPTIPTPFLVAAGLQENTDDQAVSKTTSATPSNSVATVLPGLQFVNSVSYNRRLVE